MKNIFDTKSILDTSVDNKTIICRVDYNVPFNPSTGEISDDSRILESLPTINHLLKHNCKIVLCSHLGRPKGQVLDEFKINFEKLVQSIDNQNINFYVNFIQDQLFAANKYFNDQEPWKKKSDKDRLNTILYTSLELIRKISIMLYPIIPDSSLKVLRIFEILENEVDFNSIKNNEILKTNNKLNKISILFKKIEQND